MSHQLEGARVVVATSDGGPDGEEAPPRFAEEIVDAISPTIEYLIWVDTPEGRAATEEAKMEVGLFGRLTGQGFKVFTHSRWGSAPIPVGPCRFRSCRVEVH